MNKIVDASKIIQSDLLELIDKNLENESLILKSLIESVVHSNQRTKQVYTDELIKNEEKLKDVSEASKKLQDEMLKTEAIKQKSLIEAYIGSQSEIYDLNSEYRYAILNENIIDYYEHEFFSVLQATFNDHFEMIRDNLVKYKHETQSYNEFQALIIDKVTDIIELEDDKNLQEVLKDHFETLSILVDLRDHILNETDTFYHALDLDHIITELKTSSSNLKQQLEDQYNMYDLKISSFSVHEKELKALLELEMNEALERYKKQIDERDDQTYLTENDHYLTLENEHKNILLDIEYRKSKQKAYDDLTKKLRNVEKDLSKAKQHKNQIVIGKYQIKLKAHYDKKLRKMMIQTFHDLKKDISVVLSDIENIEKNYLIHASEYLGVINNAYLQWHNHYHIMLDKLFKVTKDIQVNLSQNYRIAIDQYFESSAKLTAFQENSNLIFVQSIQNIEHTYMAYSTQEALFGLFLKKQEMHISYHAKALEIKKQHYLSRRFEQVDSLKFAKELEIKKLRLKEQLQSAIIDNEILISNAYKEYEIDVERAKHLNNHEESLIYVQEERINATVDVTKSMLRAMLERQLNFAEQQIGFAEAEYMERVKHIEKLNIQDIDYINNRMKEVEDQYLKDLSTLDKEYHQRIDLLEKRKVFFNTSKDLLRISEEIKSETDKKRVASESLKASFETNDVYLKYKNQLLIIDQQMKASKKEAYELKEKSISLFKQLKTESLEKLDAFEKTVSIPKQLPNYDIEPKKIAQNTLVSAMDSAEKVLLSKLERPQSELESLKNQMLEIEKENNEVLDSGSDLDFAEKLNHLEVEYDEKIKKISFSIHQMIQNQYEQYKKAHSIQDLDSKEMKIRHYEKKKYVKHFKKIELDFSKNFNKTMKDKAFIQYRFNKQNMAKILNRNYSRMSKEINLKWKKIYSTLDKLTYKSFHKE